jgi:predicted CoA-binding protein
MTILDRAIAEFLALDRVAVVGVSRSGDQPANLVYRKLRDGERRVFPVNPNAETVAPATRTSVRFRTASTAPSSSRRRRWPAR